MKIALHFLLLLIAFTVNAQNFWTEVSPFAETPPYYNVADISIVSENVIWVSGLANTTTVNSKWSRSLDGGVTWQDGEIELGNTNLGIASLHATSETSAYVAAFPTTSTAVGGVWMTNDSGITWNQQLGQDWNAADYTFPNFVHFWNANDGIVVCDPIPNGSFQIYTTVNAGLNWTLVPSENIPTPLTNEYAYTRNFDETSGAFWFGTNKGRLFYTNISDLNSGLVWQTFQTPVNDFSSSEIAAAYAFKNQNEGLLVSSDLNLWRTTNSGASWNQESPNGFIRNLTLTYVTGTLNSYFSTGDNDLQNSRGSAYTTDGGLNWINLDDVDEDPVFPQVVKFASGTIGFCVGTYLSDMGGTKHFFRMTDPMNRLLKKDSFEDKIKFSATPNPTGGIVNLSGSNISNVNIIDVSGKIIHSENYNGLSEVTLNLSNFRSGIYFAKVTATDGGSSTIKIIKN